MPFLKRLIVVLLLAGAAVLSARGAGATDQYARLTGKGCIFCHQESTGGQLKTVGFAYIRNGYRYPISHEVLEKAEALQTPLHKILRFVIGYLHLLAGVIFFGAIFYIHIFVKPAQLTSGIPKGERVLGLSCMAVLTVTGVYLTWVRIDRWEQFLDNTFGLMLLIKILLFAAMVGIGLTAVTIVHRRMRADADSGETADGGALKPSDLQRFDGSGDRPAYIQYESAVYDVSNSPKWKDGRHFGKHQAGQDLTREMAGAPHGPEVFEKVKQVGEVDAASADKDAPVAPRKASRVFVLMAYTNLVLIFLILVCISVWRWDFPVRLIPEKRADMIAGARCVECHRVKTPGIHADWQNSVHALVGVDCYKCHRANDDALTLKSHLQHDPKPISAVVSPVNCGGCHPKEAEEYARSKHANTHAIMWAVDYWLNDGMNNTIERVTGCYACHGTVVEVKDGEPLAGTWPNVGVGRINPDGSRGSCSSCHTRHRFSRVEARKPEACDQCHLGPDHPQIEIYNESKHGTIYHAEGDQWDWDPVDRQWRSGRDFRAPTCSVCHMSAAPETPKTHDVTERLSWELQAPLTIRPQDFKPFPAPGDWRSERAKMKRVCLQCHSRRWTEDHFNNLDAAVENYNEVYFKPLQKRMDALYTAGALSRKRYFDEDLEWEFYEFWHHEGRRARMGAAMMAPDYAWWHGFYEMKHRFNRILSDSEALLQGEDGKIHSAFPGRFEGPAP